MKVNNQLLSAIVIGMLSFWIHCGQEHNHSGHTMTTMEPAPPAAGSIFQALPLTFEDEHGKTISLTSLAGTPTVLGMIYLTCKAACPRIVADMNRIHKKSGQNNVQFILVTIDPEVDSAQSFQKTLQAHKLNKDQWKFLKGSADQTLQLAHLIGMRYKKLANGNFAHSNLITLFDETGQIVGQRTSLSEPIEPISKLLGKM